MPEIIYPITLEYVPNWGPWEVVRELATNALDADPGFRMNLLGRDELEAEQRMLSIESKGYMVERHLLLGVSDKKPNAIGQFGEGMKLALLALTRMNLRADIYSGSQHYWNEPAEMSGEQVFKVVWDEKGKRCSIPDEVTAVQISHWGYDTYEERFVRPGDPRVIYTDPFGRMILEEAWPNLYVKGVWVQRAHYYGDEFAFSYNLQDVKMNRDRGVIDAWDAGHEIGKIWASVTDAELLTQFWAAVKDGKGERGSYMTGVSIANKDAQRRAFQQVYGKFAVVGTGDAMTREAKHRGAEVVSPQEVGGSGLAEIVEDMVGTDTSYVQEMEGKSEKLIPDTGLSDEQLKNLKMARRLARKVGWRGRIEAYILPQNVTGKLHGERLKVNITELEDPVTTVRCMCHEIGHAQGAGGLGSDGTDEHTWSALTAAAKIIVSYARR